MANKQRGHVDIELDKPRRLVYDWNSIAEVEDRFDKSITELFQEMSEKMRIGNLRILLWAGLIHDDPDLSLPDVGAMIDFSNYNMIMEKITEAVKIGEVSTVKKTNGKK